MKKFLLSTFFAGLTTIAGLAQSQNSFVEGRVVDKYGYAIPGAEVTAKEGNERTVTDVDGAFRLQVSPETKKLTASYLGMSPKSLKISKDKELLFKLSKFGERAFFININWGFNILTVPSDWTLDNETSANGMFSLMVGQLDQWGWYVKPTIGSGNNDSRAYELTAGSIKNIRNDRWYLYFGAGLSYWKYRSEILHWDNLYGDWLEENKNIVGPKIELGFIVRTGKHFDLSFGINGMTNFAQVYSYGLQLGLGYVL